MTDTEVSRTLALAWGLAAAPQRGPKRELSLERIVEAAIEIADEEGLAAVTMQRVAQTFGFSTMALYRYVSTKDDLHQLMLDTAMSAGIAHLDAEDWRDGVRQLLCGLVEGYRRHPWALDIPLTSDVHLMPGQLRVADLGLRAMRDLESEPATKLARLMIISAFGEGLASVEREVLADIGVSPGTRALLEEAVRFADFPDVSPLIKNGVYFGDTDTVSIVADRGDGIEGAAGSRVAEEADSVERSGDDGPDEPDEILGFATEVLLAGLDTVLSHRPDDEPDPPGPTVPPTPQDAYELAEAELRRHKELRKRTQQRVRELERQEGALQKARDRAKELAKAHARLHRE